MKNKEFYKLLNKNCSRSNSGFTLTELLVGIIMSTFVIGALGFGLMQMLRITKGEESRVKSRTETSRAFNFIADELKAAQSIEALDADESKFEAKIKDVAKDFKGKGTVRLALNVPGVPQRIIYSVEKAEENSNWNGPNIIYRWGPPINANGQYTNTDANDAANWQNEALIDGVSDANQIVACDVDNDGTPEDITFQGFFACVVDDDGDTILDVDGNEIKENATDIDGDGDIDLDDTPDLNGDGIADSKDGADTDGVSITAQLYFSAKTEKGIYTTDSQVVARARVAPLRKPELKEPEPVYFESLNPEYGQPGCWSVRNDFGIGKDPRFDPNETTPHADAMSEILTWVHEENRQPQPLNIDTTQPFTMVASAFGGTNNDGTENAACLAVGNKYLQKLASIDANGDNASYGFVKADGSDANEGEEVATTGKEEIHTYEHKVWHTIEFPEDGDSDAEIARKKATYNAKEVGNSDVKGDGTVRVFNNDSTVPDIGGYDANNNGTIDPGDQKSLRDILIEKGLADSEGRIINDQLQDNQRIVVFEIGQTVPGTESQPNPGFDLQDNMFIMTSDAFLSNSDD